MSGERSAETRKKISEGVKKAHQRRKDAANPTKARVRSLEDGFANGHPDGQRPSRTRNYGDIGRDVTKVLPTSRAERERQHIEDVQARRQLAVEEAERKGVVRAEDRRRAAEGTSGGQVGPPALPPASKTQRLRQELMQKRAEKVGGA